jgi:tryptophan synthase beta chain
LEAAFLLAKLEGIITALDSAQALSALKQIKFNGKETVVVCLSGRGDKDMATYMQSINKTEHEKH